MAVHARGGWVVGIQIANARGSRNAKGNWAARFFVRTQEEKLDSLNLNLESNTWRLGTHRSLSGNRVAHGVFFERLRVRTRVSRVVGGGTFQIFQLWIGKKKRAFNFWYRPLFSGRHTTM